MATTVAQHSVATFTSPVNGTTPIDANTVRGNDNTIRTAYNDHDSDPGIHVQSSTLASRPVAGTAGRKWITTDAGNQKLWYDDGTDWHEVGGDSINLYCRATETLAKGDVVKITGYNSGQNVPEIAKVASASDVAFGICETAIASGSLGYVINTGVISDVNTGAFSLGNILYPNTSGWLTTTKPTSGNYQVVAYVLRANTNNGVLYVEFSAPRIVERSDNTASTVVLRDASGNFSAGTITAALTGNASTATALQTARTLWGQSFNGTANVTGNLSSVGDISMTGALSGATSVSATNLTGTLQTAAQPNVTSVGTLSSLTVSGNTIVGAEVFRGADNSYLRLAGGNPAATGGQLLMFGSTHATAPGRTVLQAQGTGYLQLSTFAGNVVLDSSGNLAVDTNTLFVDAVNNRVGVGTASPSDTFHVVGNALATGAAGSYPRFISTVGAKSWELGYRSGTSHFELREDGTERVIVSNGGNLGLGVYPSAWGSGTRALEIGPGTALYNPASNSQTWLMTNAYYDGGSFRYRNSDSASYYRMIGAEHRWHTAPSGTAGNAITFTQAMTLDSAGRLLIGYTSAAEANVPLQVDANATGSAVYTARFANTSTSTGVYNVTRWFQGASGSAVGYVGTGGSTVSNAAFQNNFVVGTQTSNPLVFTANDTERARITSGGYFKASNTGTYVGSTASYHELRTDAGNWIAYCQNAATNSMLGVGINYSGGAPNGTGNVFLQCGDTVGTRAEIRSNGGLANYSANDVNLSDQRVKKDITPVVTYWSKIKAIEVVTFKYTDQTHDDDNVGVIAQQVEAVAPEFVDADGFGTTPDDGIPLKAIYNTDLQFAALRALQEAMARIETLEQRVLALEA